MPKPKSYLFSLLLFVLFISSPIFAQEENITKEEEFADWNFRLRPYLWLVGIQGELVSPPQPSQLPEDRPRFEIDIPFAQLRTSLKFFLMLNTEYRKNRLVVLFGITSLILEGEAITPGDLIIQDIEYRLGLFTGELSAGYRFINNDKVFLDGVLGLRMFYSSISASSKVIGRQFEGERDLFWYDPIVGARFRYYPHYRVELEAYADCGPIRKIDSYQIYAQGAYHFSKLFDLALGYRRYYLNTQRQEAIFKGSLYGPYLKFGFRF